MRVPPPPQASASPTQRGARQRIVTSGLELFSSRGYNGVSMNDIAEASGVTKAALYYHFSDKEALFLEALRTRTERLASDLDRMLDVDEPLEPLLIRIATFLMDDGLGDYRQLQNDLLTVVAPERRAEHIAGTPGVIHRLLPRFEAAQQAGIIAADVDLDVALPLFFSMITGQIRRHALGYSEGGLPHTNAEIARIIVRIWLHGTTMSHSGELD